MASEKVFTINDARKERDELAAKIAVLIAEFEYYVKGVRIDSIAITRKEKADRRGIKTSEIGCMITTRLREGSGFGSDL